MSVFGERGVAEFGLLIGLLIPPINVLAVTTLIWFSGGPKPRGSPIPTIGKALMKNPLILGCAGGLLYAYWFGEFPVMVDNTLRLTSSLTLPLALLSIGGSLTLHALGSRLPIALAATALKHLVLPILGWLVFRLFGVGGLHLQIGMIFFALPTSTAMYVLCSQHDSDTELASAIIVLSTAVSFASLSLVLTFLSPTSTP